MLNANIFSYHVNYSFLEKVNEHKLSTGPRQSISMFYPLGNSCALLRYIAQRAAITYMYMYLNHLPSHPLKAKKQQTVFFAYNYWPCRAPCCLPLSAPRTSIVRSRSPHPPKSGAVRCGCCSSQALSAATADSRSDATSLSSSCALRAVAASNVHT